MSRQTFGLLVMTAIFVLLLAAALDAATAAASCVGQTFVCDVQLDPSMVTDLR